LNIYQIIHNLGTYFITTNADLLLQPKNGGERISIIDKDTKLQKHNIYHIHGSINDRQNMVFTLEQYIERYKNSNPLVKFLKKVFFPRNDLTILFLGYGMSEMEILQFFFEKIGKSQSIQKRYIFKEYFHGDEDLIDADEAFFKSMGINVIEYYIDTKGYEGITDELAIIEGLKREIITERCQRLSVKPTPENIQEILKYIKSNISVEEYFFKTILSEPDYQYTLDWFIPLYENGYFNPENNPKIKKETRLGEEMETIQRWIVIHYLIRVSYLNKQSPDKHISSLLAKIIYQIINYPSISERTLNFSTDRGVLEIIGNLSVEEINVTILKMFLTSFINNYSKSGLIFDIERYLIRNFLNCEKIGQMLLQFILSIEKDNIDIFKFRMYEDEVKKQALILIEKLLEINPIKVFCILSAKLYIIIKDYLNRDHEFSPDFYSYDDLLKFIKIQLLFSFKYITPGIGGRIIDKLLKKKEKTLRGIAIELIDNNYSIYKSIFWELKENPIVFSIPQTQNIFAHHHVEFSEKEIAIANAWIDSLPNDHKEENYE